MGEVFIKISEHQEFADQEYPYKDYNMKENCEETSRLSYDTVERKIIRKMNGFLRIRNLQIKSIQYIVVK
ncbi:unnamed protein product [Rhizophagus irregularis]|nr:unnamed protein product [Rhizophagus irregularis]CAB5346166.1 unnamed protein product [Rhizophagus irregularis]